MFFSKGETKRSELTTGNQANNKIREFFATILYTNGEIIYILEVK